MDEQEKNEILRLLAEGDTVLSAAMAGVSDDEASRRPPEGEWSVLECVEHIAVSERALLDCVLSATPADGPQHNPVREAKIFDRALDRSRTVQAPEIVIPAGKLETVSDALANFQTIRAETIACIERFEGNPRSWVTNHPLVRTPVNCYEMFLMIALHAKRHAMQIAQTRTMAVAEPQP